jgi:hypothetical protein
MAATITDVAVVVTVDPRRQKKHSYAIFLF